MAMRKRPMKPPAREDPSRHSGRGKRSKGGESAMFTPGALAAFGAASLALLGAAAFLQLRPPPTQRPPPGPTTPFPGPKLTDLPQFGGEHREALFWGTYRSNLYLGLRTRTPKSLLSGLMWVAPHEGGFGMRHACEHGDKLARYGWVQHNGRDFGRQELVDGAYDISTSFVKSPRDDSLVEGCYGGDWVVRLQVRLRKDVGNQNADLSHYRQGNFFFYLADEAGGPMELWPESGGVAPERVEGAGKAPFVRGEAPEIGQWELHALGQEGSLQMSFLGVQVPHTHNISQLVLAVLSHQVQTHQRLELPNMHDPRPNFVVLQVSGALPLTVDFVFTAGRPRGAAAVVARVEGLSGPRLTERLRAGERAFKARMQSTFQLQGRVSEMELEVAEAALSNLLGGAGYFYGQSRVARPHGQKVPPGQPPWLHYWPAALFTAVPSRSFFPRGFLWDEGFHQLVISRWDRALSLDMLAHWLDLMNAHGWIPREQILGEEARSKVPEEFILQHPSNANPPALFLVLAQLAESEGTEGSEGSELLRAFLVRALPRLEAWVRWFNRTQAGVLPGSFFWHGRDAQTDRELNPKTLMSGLDDYPRASHPGPGERHVDLRCWMALATGALARIAALTGADSAEAHQAAARQLADLESLDALHLDPKTGLYADWGLDTDAVRLVREVDEEQQQEVVRRAVTREPRARFVRHFGYVALFPLLMKILPPDSAALGTLLGSLRNESLLWTGFGLRSLATTSRMYMQRNTEHDAPYWRGPVWININFLALSALKHYSGQIGPHQELAGSLYHDLRKDLINNIVRRYHESGYLWEQYDNAKAGVGKGTHPFTGWTSLIVLIMAESF